jgi:hypothetical protein
MDRDLRRSAVSNMLGGAISAFSESNDFQALWGGPVPVVRPIDAHAESVDAHAELMLGSNDWLPLTETAVR